MFFDNKFGATTTVHASPSQCLIQYHPNGHVHTITDALSLTVKTFSYDELSRLTGASGNYGPNESFAALSYAYNAVGNMTDKEGVTLQYNDANHIHAVTN